jgi:hypothetical protein
LLAGTLCLALGLTSIGCDDNTDVVGSVETELFRASPLSALNEVPPVDSAGSGTVTVESDGTTASFSVSLDSVVGVTGVHIHSGARGMRGPARVSLYPGGETAGVNGILYEGSFTDGYVEGLSLAQLETQMRNGDAYVNVRTEDFPDGALRAQFEPVQ